jgi:hypothetical protein
MLKLEFVIHDQLWPNVTMTISRESFVQGKIVQQEKKQYDLALGKAEEMVNNHLRVLVNEIIARHKQSRVGAPQGQ